jgi:hypothetical protein
MCVLLERGDLSFIGTQEEANMLRWNRKRPDRRHKTEDELKRKHYSCPLQQNVSASTI